MAANLRQMLRYRWMVSAFLAFPAFRTAASSWLQADPCTSQSRWPPACGEISRCPPACCTCSSWKPNDISAFFSDSTSLDKRLQGGGVHSAGPSVCAVGFERYLPSDLQPLALNMEVGFFTCRACYIIRAYQTLRTKEILRNIPKTLNPNKEPNL